MKHGEEGGPFSGSPARAGTWTRTRRVVMGQATGGAGLAALMVAACGTNAGSGTGSAKPIAGPKEITWSSYQLQDLRGECA